MTNPAYEAALAAFDALNAADDRLVDDGGVLRPRSAVEAERIAAWLSRLVPSMPEPLCLAARCQHLERWKRPRESYPAGREGYLKWRKDAAHFHAERAADVLREAGYGSDVIERVRAIVMKRGLKVDPEVQAMEDALCLTFLELDFADFAARHSPEKVDDIVVKTWRKMSPNGHTLALQMPLPPSVRAQIERALSGAK